MRRKSRRISYDEFAADPGRVFEALAGEGDRLLVERSGHLYSVQREVEEPSTDLWQGYNADAVRRALKASAGALAGVDTRKLLDETQAARRQSSQGRPA
jgi:hypothetical protein